MIPIVVPQMKNMKKQRDLQPEIDKLKKKYKKDQKALAQKQMELFRKNGINPASGCLTQIVMIVVLIALFSVIRMFTLNGDVNLNDRLYIDSIKLTQEQVINTRFLYLDLAKPDNLYIMALLSGALQFLVSKMMMPEEKKMKQAKKAAKATEPKMDDMAVMMQKQSMYMMPLMNVFIGITLPSGLMLYIITQTIFTIFLNYFTIGWGGLAPWLRKAGLIK
jgi:YidC/Oxa1 family membrane protein insertase